MTGLPENSRVLRWWKNIFTSFKIFIYLFFRERGRERNIDMREEHWWAVSGMCPDWGLNLQPRRVLWPGTSDFSMCGAGLNPLSHTGHGWTSFKNGILLGSPALPEASESVEFTKHQSVKGSFPARDYALSKPNYLKKKGKECVLVGYGYGAEEFYCSFEATSIWQSINISCLSWEAFSTLKVFSHCMWHSVVVHYKNDRLTNYWSRC